MQKYGLIGYPLGPSFSKNYFNQKFESEKIDATYLNFEIPNIKDLKTVLKENPELNGLNVTIPYKEQVIPYLDDLDEDARLIGAVNVIKFTKGLFGKRLKGYNSDIIGFKRSIEPLLKETHRKALILGTGGASKAVFQGLKQLGDIGFPQTERILHHLRRNHSQNNGAIHRYCQYDTIRHVSKHQCLPRHPLRPAHRRPSVVRPPVQPG